MCLSLVPRGRDLNVEGSGGREEPESGARGPGAGEDGGRAAGTVGVRRQSH